MKNKRILFFTPSSSRGGSEMYIWQMLEKAKTDGFDVKLFSILKGELFNDDYFDIPDASYSKWLSSEKMRIIKGGINRVFNVDLFEKEVIKVHYTFKPQLWYLNTATLLDVANIAIKHNIPYVVHLHEMLSIYQSLAKESFLKSLNNAKAVIACSNAVAKPLINAGLKNVYLEYSCVNFNKIKTNQDRDIIRRSFGAAQDSFVWMMSGTRSYQKGIDFLPKIASKLNKNSRLVWLGGDEDGTLSQITKLTIKHLKLKNVYMVSQRRQDYFEYLNACDGFLLTSRSDSFPLVMNEAAFLGKPVVGFNSGGIEEFVIQKETGFVVDNFNIDELTNRMNQISTGEVILSKDKIKDQTKQYSFEYRFPIWKELLFKILSRE